jgi:hypothetical protein
MRESWEADGAIFAKEHFYPAERTRVERDVMVEAIEHTRYRHGGRGCLGEVQTIV